MWPRATLDQNADLLSKCVIFSPMDGVISVLNSEIGERVVATGDFAGTEVMRVANFGSMEARVDVNENDVVNVAVGNQVRIKVDAYPGRTLDWERQADREHRDGEERRDAARSDEL